MKLNSNQKLFMREAYKKLITDFKSWYDFTGHTDFEMSYLLGLYQPILVKKVRAFFDFLSPSARIETRDIYKKVKRLMVENDFDEFISEKTFYILFSETMGESISKGQYSKTKFYYIWCFIINHIPYQEVFVSELISHQVMEDIVDSFKKRFQG